MPFWALGPPQPVALVLRPRDRRVINRGRRPAAWEEVDFALATRWARTSAGTCHEGAHATRPDRPRARTAAPTRCWSTTTFADGCGAIIGGYVVRDPRAGSRRPLRLRRQPNGDLYVRPSLTAARSGDGPTGMLRATSLSGFGEDAAGHVYAASLDGPVYRIAASPAPGEPTSPGGGDAAAGRRPAIDGHDAAAEGRAERGGTAARPAHQAVRRARVVQPAMHAQGAPRSERRRVA